MTEEEKQAIETMKHWIDYEKANKDKINKADELIEIQEIVLNLIEKQQAEIKDYGEEYNHWAHKAVTRAIELEKKDKRISNLEFALMDMVLQFADENKDSINTMGLSALEIAFNELNFDNPMSIKEVHKRYKELAQKYYQ